MDLRAVTIRVERVAVEVAGHVTVKPYPKSRAGRRTVPVPPLLAQLLREHRATCGQGAVGEVFTNEVGGPLRRTVFRSRAWRPSLVRAGLLGAVGECPEGYLAQWDDANGAEHGAVLRTRAQAVKHVAAKAAGGLRTHDLRHSYATWLITDGVAVNDVQR